MKDTMTMKELQNATEAPKYIINYLRENRRLPLAKESKGRGYPTLYHPDSITIVLNHLNKSRGKNEQLRGD